MRFDFSPALSTRQLYTWGDGAHHKLGHGDAKPALKPKLVEALKDVRIVKAACGWVGCCWVRILTCDIGVCGPPHTYFRATQPPS